MSGKSYDAFYVLRSVFIPDQNALRVVGDGGGGGGPIEVIIDHTEDSIRLGDGTNFLTSTTDSGKIALDVNVINDLMVDIDHTSDSVRLGDGTDLTTTTTVGPKVGLDVNLVNNPTVNTPLVTNISYNVINAEDSHSFSTSTKRFMLRFRGHGTMNLAYVPGSTGTTFITLRPGTVYTEKDLDASSLTLYFRVNKTGVVEILEWS